MSDKAQQRRDKHITREIHRLFWRANLVDKWGLFICYLTRIPAVAAANIFIPLVSAYAIEAIVAKDYDKVYQYAICVVGLAVFYCVVWTVGGLFISRNAIRGQEYLQSEIFRNFLEKDYDFYSNAFFGSLGAQASRMRDNFNSYGEMVTLSIVKQVVIVGAGIGVIAFQSSLLAFITAVTMILVLSFTVASSRWRLKYRRLVGETSSVVSGVQGDALSHGSVVKSFAAEDYELQRIQEPIKALSKAQFASWVSSLPADAGRMLLAAIATAILLVLSAKMYIDGTLSLTLVVLVQLYVVKLIASTFEIAEIIKRFEDR